MRNVARVTVLFLFCLVLVACSSTTPDREPGRGSGRHQVLVEIDRMQGLVGLEDEDAGRIVEIFAEAGIDIDVRQDQRDIPFSSNVTLADLHSLMTSHSSVAADPGVWKLHVLLVSEEFGHPRTLGIMFDYGENDENDLPREGCAVFVDAHAGPRKLEEIVLTTVHELAHCFNIHHTDWEGQTFNQGSTIESYSFTDTVKWKLSSRSKDHLRHHEVKLFKPGAGGVSFGTITQAHADRHQSTPPETYTVIEASRIAAGERLIPRDVIIDRGAAERARPSPGLALQLACAKTRFRVGEPVYLTAILENETDEERRLHLDLDPRYGFLDIEIQDPGTTGFTRFLPPVWSCARRPPDVLAPRKTARATFQVFFDAAGWRMKEVGTYQVRAVLAGPGGSRISSEPLAIEIEASPNETASRVRDEIVGKREAGLFLMLEGASHLRQAQQTLERIHDKGEGVSNDQRAAIGLALCQASLRPSLPSDPSRRRPPQLDKAIAYLRSLEGATIDVEQAMRAARELADSLERGGRRAEAQIARDLLQSFERRRIKK